METKIKNTGRWVCNVIKNAFMGLVNFIIHGIHRIFRMTVVTTAGAVTGGGLTAAPTPNNAPTIVGTPSPSFVDGVAAEYDLDQHMTDADGHTLYAIMAGDSLPSGVTLRANGDDNALVYDGIGAATSGGSHTLTANDLIDTSSPSSTFDIPITASEAAADIIVRADGGGDHTTINAALAAVATGETIEIQANILGGSQMFTENVLLEASTANGTNGNECVLRGRAGDSIRLQGTGSGADTRFWVKETSFWQFKNIKQCGTNMWSIQRPPGNESGQYESQYGIFVQDNSHHLLFEDWGDRTQGNDNKIWGANNFSANMFGFFARHDGCHHIKLKECHFELHGDNNSGVEGDFDWGDLMRIPAYAWIIEDCTGLQAGHNVFSIEETQGIMRNTISDQDWRPHSTGEDGYRAGEIAMDKSEFTPGNVGGSRGDVGDVLIEGCIFRNAYDGGSPNAQAGCKWQARRGVFRYNHIVTTRALGIKADRNAGAEGSVTESCYYHNTLWDCESIWRQGNSQNGYEDLHEEQMHVNFLIVAPGPGDQASVGTSIYWTDKSTSYTPHADAWQGSQWRGVTYDNSSYEFELRFENNSGTTKYNLADAISAFPSAMINWDEDTVGLSNTTAAATSFVYQTAYDGLKTTTSPSSLTDVEDLTTMVGSGSSATTGTFDNGKYFVLADTDLDLSYFGEENDYVDIGGSVVQLLTLNKDTGVATWDVPITWSGGDGVNHVPGGIAKPTQRGSHQP